MTEGDPRQEQFRDKDELQSNEYLLEASVILERLFEVCEEVGEELDPTDLENILGEDENDFLGNIASFALERLGLDHEVLYERLGIDAEFKMFHYTLGEIAQWDSFAKAVYVAAFERRQAKRNEQSST